MASPTSTGPLHPLNLQQAQRALQSQLVPLYLQREAATITDWVMENITGKKKIDRIVHKDLPLTSAESALLERYTAGLLARRPVQYVLHESWFCGMKFYVDEAVLIPRPETEELVEWVAAEAASCDMTLPETASVSVLDVGTGSGCIAICLQRLLPRAEIYACDVSEQALVVARRNADILAAPVHFRQLNFLDPLQRDSLPAVQFLVSNPPYIPLKDKALMTPQVVDHEPHLALFVKDEDPLVFYKALAEHGRTHLLTGGSLYAEIHEELAAAAETLFRQSGYQQIIVKKDMQGKHRMIKARM